MAVKTCEHNWTYTFNNGGVIICSKCGKHDGKRKAVKMVKTSEKKVKEVKAWGLKSVYGEIYRRTFDRKIDAFDYAINTLTNFRVIRVSIKEIK